MIKKEIINLSKHKEIRFYLIAFLVYWLFISCNSTENKMIHNKEITAKEILNNPEYLAISYGGYRHNTRDIQPTMDELKEDLKILSSLGIKILRTYNLQLPQAPNILKAIKELKQTDPNFEMYVMLGAWIDCENAWTNNPNHEK